MTGSQENALFAAFRVAKTRLRVRRYVRLEPKTKVKTKSKKEKRTPLTPEVNSFLWRNVGFIGLSKSERGGLTTIALHVVCCCIELNWRTPVIDDISVIPGARKVHTKGKGQVSYRVVVYLPPGS